MPPQFIQGGQAHNTSVTSNPNYIGGPDENNSVVGARFTSAGELTVTNAPRTKWVQGTASIMTAAGGSVLVLPAGGAGVFTYITGLQYAGFGPSSVLLTIAGGFGSVLGRYMIPAGGTQQFGLFPNAIKTGANAVVTASIGGKAATTSSVFVGIQGFISNT